MAEDLYGLGASGIPPELAAEMMGLKGRKAISQALLEQSMQSLQAPEVKGRFSVPISPLQGVAKLAQAYMGQKGLTETDKSMGDLATRYKQGEAEALGQYEKTKQGVPGAMVPQVGEMGETYPAMEQGGVKGNPRKAVMDALNNAYLKNNPLVAFDMARMGKAEDLSEAATLRTDENKRRDAEARQAREDMIRLTASLKTPPQEPAPSVKDILDPKDSSRMISVDTRVYKPGGSLGDPGVIGIAGKEPTAAKKEEQRSTGIEAVNSIIDEMENYYDKLNKNRDIASTQRGALSNLVSGIQTSGVGQVAGRLAGTESQSFRDSIMQNKMQLTRSIMNATGMSARQMDSNRELQLMLDSATDPKFGYETNMRSLRSLRERYGSAKPSTKPAATPEGGGWKDL